MASIITNASTVPASQCAAEALDDWECIEVGDLDAVCVSSEIDHPERYPDSKNEPLILSRSAKLHARSVAKQLDVNHGLIFLSGQREMQYEDSDQAYPFRQHRYFYYLSGVQYPGCALTYDIGDDTLRLFTPPARAIGSVIFNGQVPSATYFLARSHIDIVCTTLDLEDHIRQYLACNEDGVVYTMQATPLSDMRELMKTRMHSKQGLDYVSLKPAMNASRAIKSPYEIRQIRRANAITTSAHVSVLRSLSKLRTEAEIEAIFAATCTSQGAKRQAYDIIAGSGHNASVLHYGANDEPLKGRQLVCLDAGCEWECYASDVTRTFPIAGTWTEEAKAIQQLVTRMQNECIEMVKPGADYKDIHLHAHAVATRGLMDLGLLHNGTYAELCRAGASVAFFPHGVGFNYMPASMVANVKQLGHYVGLEVHDYGGTGGRLLMNETRRKSRVTPGPTGASDGEIFSEAHEPFSTEALRALNPYMAADSILKVGHVITVEPGIYFPKPIFQTFYLRHPRFGRYINADVLARYFGVGGVRIEDDLLLVAGGCENLTTAPKGEEMLQIIREGWGSGNDGRG